MSHPEYTYREEGESATAYYYNKQNQTLVINPFKVSEAFVNLTNAFGQELVLNAQNVAFFTASFNKAT